MDLSQEISSDVQDDHANHLNAESSPQDYSQSRKGDEANVSGAESNMKEDDSPPNETSDDDFEDDDSKGEDAEVVNREYQFRTKSFHIIKTRQGKKQYKCDVCTGIYQHAFSLKRHFLRTHINYKYLSEADVTNCNINLNLVRKLKAEDDAADGGCPGLYRCHICTELFDTREELKCHDSSHPDSSAQKGFSCNQCEMTFPHRQNLVRHQSVHAGERRFACKHCGKCFPSLNNQRRHEKTHEVGNALFSCPTCGVSFAEGNDLRRHCRKAHPDRFHPCVSCTKFFTSREKLEKHAQAHRTARAIEASDSKESRAHALFKKKKKKGKRFEPHIEYKYSCSVCKRRFATYVNMCRHKKALHQAGQHEKRTRSTQLRKEAPKPSKAKDLPEEEFYMTIAHRISENLLYYLDGKSSQLKIRRDQGAFPEEVGSKDNLHWSFYNFPAAFDITQMMQIYSNRVPSYNALSNDGSDNSDEVDLTDPLRRSARNPCEQKEVWKPLPKIFVCSVCTEKFPSLQAIEDHKVNNHPNVICTHVELEGQKEVPPELCWTLKGPVGMCSHDDVPQAPVVWEQEKLRCTKCESVFESRDDLHQHILDCGDNSGFDRTADGQSRRYGLLVRRSAGIITYVRGRKRFPPWSRSLPRSSLKRPRREEQPVPPLPPRVDELPREAETNEEMVDRSVDDEECQQHMDRAHENEDGSEEEEGPVGEKVDLVEEDLGVAEVKSDAEERTGAEETVDVVENKADVAEEKPTIVVEKELVIEDGAFEVVGSTEEVIADEAMNGDVTVAEDEVSVEDNVPIYTCQRHPSEVNPDEGRFERQQLPESSSDALQVHDYLPTSSPGELTGNSFKENCGEESADEKGKRYDSLTDIEMREEMTEEPAGHPQQPEGRILRSRSAVGACAAPFRARKHHTCNTCKRKFAYLASLKKHLQDICPNKKVAGAKATRRRGGRGKVLREQDRDAEQYAEHYDEPHETESTQPPEAEDPDTGCDRLGDLDVFPEDDANIGAREELVDASGNDDSLSRAQESEDDVPSPTQVLVKEENLDAERGKRLPRDHCCPYCLHSFAYLSNFRKHIRDVCLVMKKAMESKDTKMKLTKLRSISTCAIAEVPSANRNKESPSSTAVNLKGDIENSVINLLRNQSKQIKFIGSPSASNEQRTAPSSPNFMTFSCPVCHKIFLSYVKMLQHRLSHKLNTDEGVKDEPPSIGSHQDAGSGDKMAEKADAESLSKSEEERFDEILGTLKNPSTPEPAIADLREEDDVVCLSELHDLPDEDEEKVECQPVKTEDEETKTDVSAAPGGDTEGVMSEVLDGKTMTDRADNEGGDADEDKDKGDADDELQDAVTPKKKLNRKMLDGRKRGGTKAKAAPGRPRQKKVPVRLKGVKNKL